VEREDDGKRAVAEAAVEACVKSGMTIGLGTGSTAYWAIRRVGERIARGERISAVATSRETERLCREHGIPLLGLLEAPELDTAIDGADEVTSDFCAIKGGGGALFRERAVALTARSFALIVTEKKIVNRLGAFPLPVEVVPFAIPYVLREVRTLGVAANPRTKGDAPFVTDNGNHILDCRFGSIAAPEELDRRLRSIHGVVTTGLFTNLIDRVFVGAENGAVRELQPALGKR
jgi:ribose 5-phosphate isomerase A